MSYQFTISDIGLRLIKAYEGFLAEPVNMATGERVVGFGHRIPAAESVTVNEGEAEELLKSELESVEDFINTHVHAAMTQSQFDALCSLVFSIGKDAFLKSDVYHAFNQGQIIDAANGFDVWRLSEIEGETYMVDALVRRRTAEKALFLRPTHRLAPAPGAGLDVQEDKDISDATYERITSNRQTAAIVPAQIIARSDHEEDTEIALVENNVEVLTPAEDRPSPIAAAAAEVSDRLDALMAERADNDDLVTSLAEDDDDKVVKFRVRENGSADDETYELEEASIVTEPEETPWPFVLMSMLGLAGLLGGIWLSPRSTSLLSDWGPLAAFTLIFVGALLFIAGAYYALKQWINSDF